MGDPLVCETSNDTYQLAGVLSWGPSASCDQPNSPRVFTAVSHQLPFVFAGLNEAAAGETRTRCRPNARSSCPVTRLSYSVLTCTAYILNLILILLQRTWCPRRVRRASVSCG